MEHIIFVLKNVFKQIFAFLIGAVSVVIATYISFYLFFTLLSEILPAGWRELIFPVTLLFYVSTLYATFFYRNYFQITRRYRDAWYVGYFVVVAFVAISLTLLGVYGGRGSRHEDAAIRAEVNNTRAIAEIYFTDSQNSYLSFCTNDSRYLEIKKYIESLVFGDVLCVDSPEAYAVSVPLKNQTEKFYCVDSLGNAGIFESQTISEDDLVCGN